MNPHEWDEDDPMRGIPLDSDVRATKRPLAPTPLAKALGFVIGVGLTVLFVCFIIAACFYVLRSGGVID